MTATLVARFKTVPYGLPSLANRTSSPIPWEIQKLGEINHAAADRAAGTVERVVYQAMLKAREAIDLKALARLLDDEDAHKEAAENVGSLWAARIALAVQPHLHKVVVESGKTASRTFLHKAQISYEAETARIKERAKRADAKEPHRFKAAAWTHPNGHPRCAICGQEQPLGGRCNMPATWYRNSLEARAELALISVDVKYPALAGAVALQDKFTKHAVNYRNAATAGRSCGSCRFMNDDGSCQKVQGYVTPDMLCDLFAPEVAIKADAPTAGLSFDLLNPRALDAAKTITAQLVRDVSQETKAAIRQIMGYSFENGLAPRQAAKLIQQTVGLTNRQAAGLMKFRDSLKGTAGMTAAKLDARTDAQASRLLRRRANLIARTETIRASTAGQQALWSSAVDRGLFSKDQAVQVWIVTHDSRLEPDCRDYEGETAPIDGTFKGDIDGPPLHPACRCTVGLQFVDANQQLNPPQVDEELPDTEPWTVTSDMEGFQPQTYDQIQQGNKAFTQGDEKNAVDMTRMDSNVVRDELAKLSGLSDSVIQDYTGGWMFSSQGTPALLMHNAIAEKFGIKMPEYLQKKYDALPELTRSRAAEARTFVDAVYARTQAELKRLGINELIVSRGMGFAEEKLPSVFEDTHATIVKPVQVDSNPLSSWSIDQETAQGFTSGWTEKVILSVKVPSERIFGLWWSGVGTYDEKEVVVLGGKTTVGARRYLREYMNE